MNQRPGASADDCKPASPEVGAPIEYTLRFERPHEHYVEVTATYPTEGQRELELMMAVWTPGSYMVREYSRHVERLSAATEQGAPLALSKTTKNRWRVTTGGAARVVVRYRVYGRELTVRTNFIEGGFAMLNGAPTFITLADGKKRAHEVQVVPYRGWGTTVTGLASLKEPLRFRAESFDQLVDSPIVSGVEEVLEFEIDGKPHVLATQGKGGVWDSARALRDTKTIVETQRRFWGSLPYDRYVFMNLLVEGYGGLEHANSTVLMSSRWATRDREDYLTWLGLVSHEFFHTWNVKRMRPIELGPFDYEREVFTKSLWVAEGMTAYYDDLLVHRAGLMTRDEYLKRMGKNIERLQSTPGRKVHPLDQSSYDAWIKLYKADENTGNSSVSYYIKGAVVAWLLDLTLRRVTDGNKSLDDFMLAAYERFSGACGFTDAQIRALVSDVAGRDMSAWLDRHVSGTEELAFDEALAWVGLRFKSNDKKKLEGAAAEDPWASAEPAWLGVETKGDGRMVITKVLRESPAHAAGLNVDDELIAIDELRVRNGDLDARLKRHRPGDAVKILVARRDQLLTLPVTLGQKPGQKWELEVVPDAAPEVVARRDAWLAGRSAAVAKK